MLQRSLSKDVPDWMAADGGETSLDQFITPPRLKVVQGTAKPPLSDLFNPGDVCLTPLNVCVAEKGKPFTVVPLFMFAEWLETNPLEAGQFIRARTLDPKHPIAIKSRSPETRREPWDAGHGGNDPTKFVSFVETLNFIMAIVGHPDLTGTMCSVGFAKTEHKTGGALSAMIRLRGVKMFGTVWDVRTSQRTNDKGAWWGLNFSQHAEDAGIVTDRESYEFFKAEADKLRAAHLQQRLVVEQDYSEDEAAQAGNGGASF